MIERLNSPVDAPPEPHRPRCLGDCCVHLSFGSGGRHWSPDQLARVVEVARTYLREGLEKAHELSQELDVPIADPEVIRVAGMMRYLGTTPRGFQTPRYLGPQRAEVVHHYTCRHLKACGDCGIYEDRPRLCRNHGTRYPCDQRFCPSRPLLTGPTLEDDDDER